MQQAYLNESQAGGSQAVSNTRHGTKDKALYQKHHKAAVSESPAAAVAAKQPLSWNEFQHAHAGAGWTKAELSAAYGKAKASVPAAETETVNWNAFQHANIGRHWSRERMSEEYQAARQHAVDISQQSKDVQKHSEWNAYLHRHKGLGWTRVGALHCVLQLCMSQLEPMLWIYCFC